MLVPFVNRVDFFLCFPICAIEKYIVVDFRVCHAQLLLVGLSFPKTCGGLFVNYGLRRAEITQKIQHFSHGQVAYGVEVVAAVSPFREISHGIFAAVARARDEAAFRLRYEIQRGHPETRIYVSGGFFYRFRVGC